MRSFIALLVAGFALSGVPGAQAYHRFWAGCNYDANGVGGLLGQVICDSVFVQGGASAGSATIGYTKGARYDVPPEISLVE